MVSNLDARIGVIPLVLGASFVATWLLVGVVRKIVIRVGVIDVPNSRSSHAAPTPRGGGLAIVLITLAAVVVAVISRQMQIGAALAWIGGGTIVAVSGMVDDIRGLSARLRVGIQAVAALAVLVAAGGVAPLPMPGGLVPLGYWGWVVAGLAIIWSINLYNFMDGIDGLAAAQALFVSAGGALLVRMRVGNSGNVELPLLALTGASMGFLLWNLPPAKIFMGDVGSGFIGFALAASAILSTTRGTTNLWSWLALNGLFFTDATTTLVSRLFRRQRLYEAHRSHAYQYLARHWKSHGAVTVLYSVINLAWCLPWAIAATRIPARGYEFLAAELLPLVLLAVVAGAGRREIRNSVEQ